MLLIAFGLTYVLGKDINWDLINYHYYVAHAWTHDKFHADVFGAGPNSYFNPLPHLPFYWMNEAGWHSLVIGLTLAYVHCLNAILIWEICEQGLFRGMPHSKQLTVLSVALATSSPVFIALLGGTFVEPLLSIPVFGGVLVAIRSIDEKDPGKTLFGWLLAGFLLGAVTGLKLTSIVFAAALGIGLVAVVCLKTTNWRTLIAYGVGLIIGYAAFNGWFAWRLFEEFGNPFFPFFNEIFRSPDFSTAKLDHDRFKLFSLQELVVLPFRLAVFHNWIYVERIAPDIRPALLTIFAALLGIRAAYLQLTQRTAAHTSTDIVDYRSSQTLVIVFFCATFFFWVWTTGNGRYGLPLLLLVGPILVYCTSRLAKRLRTIVALMCFALAAQGVQIAFSWSPRWDSTGWTDNWFQVNIPARLKERPHAYLSLGGSHSNSLVAPFVHPSSAFASIAGSTYTFPPNGPGSARFRKFIDQNRASLRMLIATDLRKKAISGDDIPVIELQLRPWGLKINSADCEFIQINLESVSSHSAPALENGAIDQRTNLRLITCGLSEGLGEDEKTLAERRRLTPVFDAIEEFCPLLFSPRGWHLSKYPSGWQRKYLQSDMVVTASRGRIYASKAEFGPFDIPLGTIDEWEQGKTPFDCKRPARPW
jgi:hypothetical protein